MLNSAAEAEDIVQDAWVRWQTTDRSPVRNPLAFLVAATTRLAINVLHSARARRETCAGSWLPELVDTTADPGLRAEQGEALNCAVLLLLEKLSPAERAAYVLREAFNYPYREIAAILRVEDANARQLVTRARERVSGGRRAPVSPAGQRRLLNAFVAAARTGDLARLESVFVSDVVSTSDGGGVGCARLPVAGREPFGAAAMARSRDVERGVRSDAFQTIVERRNVSMRSTVWLMIVFVASGVGAGAPRVLADAGSAATLPLARQSADTRTAPPPDLRALPTAPAPGALATVLLPETEGAVSALIQRLPPAVAGHQRSSAVRPAIAGAVVVGYGDDRLPNPVLRLQVIDLRRGDFFPTNWTGGQVAGFIAQAKAAMEAGRDGDLFWLRDETLESAPGPTGRVVTYGVLFGRIDSPWLFNVQGDTSEGRDALLTAVVAAARSASGR